jgi:hypothetical protein
MQKQELLSILITFVVGFIAGAFLYLNVFPTMIQGDGIGSLEDQEAFEITSQAYGGCRGNCPAFQIAADATYRYQYTDTVGEEPILRSGTLPRSLQRDIRREITTRAIAIQTTQIPPQDCPSQTDGIDIRYDITIDGASYRLDSCRTAIDFDSDAWLVLNDLWGYFNEISQ